MEPSLDQLRKNYERFDDNKLTRIATEEAAGLRPEAVDLLKQVIKERGLSGSIIKGIDAQLQEVDDRILSEYAELLRGLPCPLCKSTDEKLNATMTGSVISFIIMTNYQKELKVACPNCLDKANDRAMIKSALFGWWGFPWGIIRTPQALLLNNKMKKQNRLSEPNDLFNAFVLGKIGRLEANRNNPTELQEIIEHIR
ncbi:hypothetical protein [Pedobacter sp. SYSU D00535]|uniref:hypothetical protein n=1 Tax=Pedobacter sp. SYSU D00535 TaxID=2810308 RepID=UPI001A97CA56|nr:hypothetical protein [Pedobacter sp. SYSU D00535]